MGSPYLFFYWVSLSKAWYLKYPLWESEYCNILIISQICRETLGPVSSRFLPRLLGQNPLLTKTYWLGKWKRCKVKIWNVWLTKTNWQGTKGRCGIQHTFCTTLIATSVSEVLFLHVWGSPILGVWINFEAFTRLLFTFTRWQCRRN